MPAIPKDAKRNQVSRMKLSTAYRWWILNFRRTSIEKESVHLSVVICCEVDLARSRCRAFLSFVKRCFESSSQQLHSNQKRWRRDHFVDRVLVGKRTFTLAIRIFEFICRALTIKPFLVIFYPPRVSEINMVFPPKRHPSMPMLQTLITHYRWMSSNHEYLLFPTICSISIRWL